MDPDQTDQTAPIGAVCSGSTLFILYLICQYCWQLFASDNFNRRHFSDAFFLGALRVNRLWTNSMNAE